MNKNFLVVKRINFFLALSFITVLFYGCMKSKSCTPTPPNAEATQMLAYAAAEGMNVTSHASGLYYEVIDPGTGDAPDANSSIVVTYLSKTLDGTVIDDQQTPNTSAIPLSSFIEGWRIGLPFIGEGGTIQLLVPSALAFGCEPYRSLPGNTVLFFEIHLISVEP
jgi:FKBP-type peptidyl-prolyl cis-trans isomerase FkpA